MPTFDFMKELLKKIIKSLPIAFTRNQQYDRDTEQVLRRVLHSKANCVDVGCHKGEVLDVMLRKVSIMGLSLYLLYLRTLKRNSLTAPTVTSTNWA